MASTSNIFGIGERGCSIEPIVCTLAWSIENHGFGCIHRLPRPIARHAKPSDVYHTHAETLVEYRMNMK